MKKTIAMFLVLVLFSEWSFADIMNSKQHQASNDVWYMVNSYLKYESINPNISKTYRDNVKKLSKEIYKTGRVELTFLPNNIIILSSGNYSIKIENQNLISELHNLKRNALAIAGIVVSIATAVIATWYTTTHQNNKLVKIKHSKIKHTETQTTTYSDGTKEVKVKRTWTTEETEIIPIGGDLPDIGGTPCSVITNI